MVQYAFLVDATDSTSNIFTMLFFLASSCVSLLFPFLVSAVTQLLNQQTTCGFARLWIKKSAKMHSFYSYFTDKCIFHKPHVVLFWGLFPHEQKWEEFEKFCALSCVQQRDKPNCEIYYKFKHHLDFLNQITFSTSLLLQWLSVKSEIQPLYEDDYELNDTDYNIQNLTCESH